MSSEMLLPDEKSEANEGPSMTNKRSRKGRILIVSGLSVFILIGAAYLVFGGDSNVIASTEKIVSNKLNDAAPGEFVDSRLQDALKMKMDEEKIKKLRQQVQDGSPVAEFKNVAPEEIEPVVPVVTEKNIIKELITPEEGKNLFAEIDRFTEEQKERNAKIEREERIKRHEAMRDKTSNRPISSRQSVPTESGREITPEKKASTKAPVANFPASQNPNNAGNVVNVAHQNPTNTGVNSNYQENQQRNIGFAKLAQSMRSQVGNNVAPVAVYHVNQQIKEGINAEAYRTLNLPASGTSGTSIEGDGKGKESRVLTMQYLGDLGTAWLEGLVDSDVPSAMVTAEILDGPLRGGRVLGSHSFEGECILIDFNKLQWRGREVNIRAAAADEKTGQTCLSGKINRRITQRYGVPILFSVARVGQTYHAQKGSSTSTVDGYLGTSTVTDKNGSSFNDVAKQAGIDGTLDALQNPVDRLTNMPIQVKKDQGVIGIRWLERVDIDMSLKR